jgi:hypothetical protein
MLTEQDRDEVRQYFAVFTPTPGVELDASQHTNEESYLLIEGGGLSIGKILVDVPSLATGGKVKAHRYFVYNHEGEDDGGQYTGLGFAVKQAMLAYAAELYRRVEDRIVTAAQAAEWENSKRSS